MGGEGVQGEVAEEVAAKAGLNLVQGVAGIFDPREGDGGGELFEVRADVGVAETLGGAGQEEEEIFEEEAEGAEEGGGFLLAFGSGAVGFGHFEEGGVVGVRDGDAEEEEGVGAGGDVGFEVKGEGSADGSLGQSGDEGAVGGGPVGAAVGEKVFELFGGEGAEADEGAAGADGGEELAGVFGAKDEVGVRGWLLEDLEEGVGGFLHEGGGGDDEDLAGGIGGEVLGGGNEGADLAEFDEELGRVGGDDEDVGMGLDEDAGVFAVGLDFEVFAGGDGGGDLLVERGGGGDAGAVAADSAEGGEGLAGGPELAGLALALDSHCEEEGEGVLAGSRGAGEDERVREAAGGDGGTEAFDSGCVAEEVVKGFREGLW